MHAENPRQQLPSVDRLVNDERLAGIVRAHGRTQVVKWARQSLRQMRAELQSAPRTAERDELIQAAADAVLQREADETLNVVAPVINATGVVLHTNLGRAPLADAAVAAIRAAAGTANVEIDLHSGQRRHRGYQLDTLWRDLTGAAAALVVNNCAAATLLTLQVLAAGREVVVSRGQLVEIGGAFRLPDVFQQSGARLREVGTTNRTRLSDYERAIGPYTAALLRVHPSNFRVVGFTEDVPIGDLVQLAHSRGLMAIDDVGSGALFDLSPFGLPGEPVVRDSLAAGADVVLFSGDKLLGGPQCGVILGKVDVIEHLRNSPLARALRIDKLTLAALQATLQIHRAGRALDEIPVLRQLTVRPGNLHQRASTWKAAFDSPSAINAEVVAGFSAVGGGSLPTASLPTWLLAVQSNNVSADELARQLRTGTPRILGRIEDGRVVLDPRTVLPRDEPEFIGRLRSLAAEG